ncbi:MAG: VCBS repeat-containing protein [Candidatus Midichloria sp.]|nr:VCBS repeat-containing protein [Candidatus Midichloria sp.]
MFQGKIMKLGYNPKRLSLADVNLNVKLNVVVATSFDHPISILLGDGQGSFSGYKSIDLRTYAIVATDINNDGRTDIVATSRGSYKSLLAAFNIYPLTATTSTTTTTTPTTTTTELTTTSSLWHSIICS